MRTIHFLLIICFCFYSSNLFAQDILPAFTVKNSLGKISVSWQHRYSNEIKGISIQRSYDSIRNFSSIVTVDNPRDIANGFIDLNAPYPKMFYRLFIAFDSGNYLFTTSQRPVIDNDFDMARALKKIREDNQPKTPVLIPKKTEPAYPSQRIYTNKENNVVINIAEFTDNTFSVKFFDEEYKPLFNLNRITESYLIMERGNFKRASWFFFEIYKNGELLEKNRFYIPKD